MTRLIDDLLAIRIIKLILTPFKETKAYRLGIIDKNGNNLIPSEELSSEQRDAYSKLDVLVFNIKKIINRLPGGESNFKNIVASYLLVKESLEADVDLITENNLLQVQSDIKYQDTFERLEEEAPANNSSGGGVSGLNSDDVAVNTKKRKNQDIIRRLIPVISPSPSPK